MAFNNTLGNTLWRIVRSDTKINSLATGVAADKFDQILDLLTINKQYYLQNGQTEDQWFDRILHFAHQRGPGVHGNPFVIDGDDVSPVDYMNAKDITWFEDNDERWNIATKILITAVDEKGRSWYTSATEKAPDDNLMGPSDSDISSLSWLPANYISLHDKLVGSYPRYPYSKYIYLIKMSNIHLRYSEPSKMFGEVDIENTTAISHLDTTKLNDLLAYVRETYVSRPDDKINEDIEAACEMLEFDIAQ
jgi:hypothetical protein